MNREQAFPLIFRSVFQAVSMFTVTKCVELVPLTIFEAIITVYPFVTGLLVWIWLGERLSLLQLVCMFFCLGGVMAIIFSEDENEQQSIDQFSSYELGVALCCVCVLLFALSVAVTRKLRNLHYSVIQWHLAITLLILSSIWLLVES